MALHHQGWIFGSLVLICLAAMSFFHQQLGDLANPNPQPITAQIRLDNRCELQDHALVVRDTMTGRYAPFNRGVAKLRTVERNRIRLELSPRFSDVELFSSTLPAKETMTITAQCDDGGWLFHMISR